MNKMDVNSALYKLCPEIHEQSCTTYINYETPFTGHKAHSYEQVHPHHSNLGQSSNG